MIKHAIYVAIAAALTAIFLSFRTEALDQIVRPYQSLRSAAMGGVRITTGLYDENFFGNPARVTANPESKIQLPDPMFETTTSTISAVGDLVDSSDVLEKIGDKAGTNLHGRIQLTFPGVYLNLGKMSYGLAFISSTQFDVDLRRSFQLEPDAITDIGPAFTVGRKFMDEDRLSVGITTHFTYRLSAKQDFTFVDLLKGTSLGPSQSGGEGAHVDFGIGATYRVPWKPSGFDITTGVSINNVLGGRYSNINLDIVNIDNLPRQQPRAYNLGVSASKPELWKFTDFIVAFEVTDIGNNPNGSLFRTLHFGAEARWKSIIPRIGFNQGYISGGVGFDFGFFSLDLATYGEELALNSGDLQDRRIGARFAFQI